MGEIFRLAICDDDDGYAERIQATTENYLKRIGQEYAILRFSSGEELIDACEQAKLPEVHLLILDVEMKQINGIEVKNFSTCAVGF